MIINLSDVLSEHHKPIDQVVGVEMTRFKSALGWVPVLEKSDAHIVVKHVKSRELIIAGDCRIVLGIPCDRCLEPVAEEFNLEFENNVDLTEGDVESDE